MLHCAGTWNLCLPFTVEVIYTISSRLQTHMTCIGQCLYVLLSWGLICFRPDETVDYANVLSPNKGKNSALNLMDLGP